jgi:hypothetical protein
MEIVNEALGVFVGRFGDAPLARSAMFRRLVASFGFDSGLIDFEGGR